jgi:hypothetical protein
VTGEEVILHQGLLSLAWMLEEISITYVQLLSWFDVFNTSNTHLNTVKHNRTVWLTRVVQKGGQDVESFSNNMQVKTQNKERAMYHSMESREEFTCVLHLNVLVVGTHHHDSNNLGIMGLPHWFRQELLIMFTQ